MAVVKSQSQQAWEDFFDEMLARGLRQPLLVISDGNPGQLNAIERKFPHAYRQRCIAHKLRDIMVKLPHDIQHELLAKVKEVYYAQSHESAQLLAARFIEQYAKEFPAAVKCFSVDLDACLVHLKFPAGYHRFICTERAFVEEQRRTKILPRHVHERGMMGLVFGVLWRASQRWQRVTMSDVFRIDWQRDASEKFTQKKGLEMSICRIAFERVQCEPNRKRDRTNFLFGIQVDD